MTSDQIVQMCAGNPGALQFILNANKTHPETLEVLRQYGIKGTDLYVLWSDICGRDMDQVARVVSKAPKEKLIDACSRQDYSGVGILQDYL